MSAPHLKITFELDGSGIYYDPAEPIHLDALMAVELATIQYGHRHLTRSDVPDDVRLPLCRRHIGDTWVWCASALFPAGPQTETVRHWRCRFRQDRAPGLTAGSPNLTNGVYRDWNMPVPLLLCHRLVGYATGDRREVKNILKRLKALGKKRSQGFGKIVSVAVERIEEDRALTWEGAAMRWLPAGDGVRRVRPRPPYWNPHGAVPCCEVGAEVGEL